MGQLPSLAKILADIEKASEQEHPDPLTTPYDTLRSLPQTGTSDPYITDSSSDLLSTESSCCSPTEDQETIPPPLPPPRKDSPTLSHIENEKYVNGSIKGIQQQLLSNQKSISLPTSSATSPMPGQTSKNSSHSSNKDVVRSFKKSRKSPAKQPSSTISHSFSDLFGDQPSNLEDAITNV